jgi:hypothetical protein
MGARWRWSAEHPPREGAIVRPPDLVQATGRALGGLANGLGAREAKARFGDKIAATGATYCPDFGDLIRLLET